MKDFVLIEDFCGLPICQLYILRIDKESYSEKSDILVEGAEFFG